MKILSWNLNHRTNELSIDQRLLEIILEQDPDYISLNEFVDKGNRGAFYKDLENLGYSYIEVSSKIKDRSNQVLIASKLPISKCSTTGPSFSDHTVSNFLHIKTKHSLNLIGLRIPSKVSKNMELWILYQKIIQKLKNEIFVFIGDFNLDLLNPKVADKRLIEIQEFCSQYPKEWDFSYSNHDGSVQSMLDFSLVSNNLSVLSCKYLPLEKVSDHKCLVLELE